MALCGAGCMGFVNVARGSVVALPFAPAPGTDIAAVTPKILEGYIAATRPLKFPPPTTESNDWVIDGTLSASGQPRRWRVSP